MTDMASRTLTTQGARIAATILLLAVPCLAADVPPDPVRVVALKMDGGHAPTDHRAWLGNKLAGVLADLGATNADLVVVPEYTFYIGYENDPVRIVADGAGYYRVVSTGSTNSDEIAAAVGDTQAWARSNNVNVVLGTVADQVVIDDDPEFPTDVVFNTQLVIDRQGRIIGYRRKVVEWTSLFYPYPNAQIKQLALQSVRTFTLFTQGGASFVVFPIICDEYSDHDMLTKAANFNADLVVNTERVQEFAVEIETLTQRVQGGTWDPAVPGWKTIIRDIYLKGYVVSRNVLKPGGWLVKANSHAGTAGMIELHVPPGPLASLTITDDYVHGAIQFANRIEYTNQTPLITTAPGIDPDPVVLPSSATVAVEAADPDSGPLPLVFTWSKVSGAGSVSFASNGTADATSSPASFSAAGSYILRAEASDGLADTVGDFGVLVTDGGAPVNGAPAVSAGRAVTVTLPSSASLQGLVMDDGLPGSPGAVTVTWSYFKPGVVTFGNTHALATTATISSPGSYMLCLTASDGALSSSSYVTVTVHPAPPSPDAIAPAISMTSPTNGSAVSGFVVVSADASDGVGIDGVQFRVDGRNLGAEYYGGSSYTLLWNSMTATAGAHALTAVARDAAGNSRTSAVVTVTVEPVAEISGFELGAAGVSLAFASVTGRFYTVESADKLTAFTDWQILTNDIPGTGYDIQIGDVSPVVQRFYRLKVRLD